MNDMLCPKMEEALKLLGKKWTGLIILSLLDSPRKFSDMEHFITNISSRLLTERLKDLINEDIIKKEVYAQTPVLIEYRLTDKGLDLSETYKKIAQWTEKWN
ncbi:MAG: helix-turn-helix transcriptional regulator [Acholeplasmataceae bacterium]|nr:helix-turn-helix transcriptional regulator [Acholeplasmataceae bacterium]